MHFDLPKEGSRHVEARSIPSDFRPISRSNRFLSLVLYLACATLCLWNGRTHAAGTIQDLIDSAPPGTKVTLHAATYFEHGIVIRSDVTLEGAGAAQTIIDAQKLGRPFHVLPGAKLELRGVTIQNGLSGVGSDEKRFSGGGILNEGTLEISDCTIQGSATSNFSGFSSRYGNGGGIANYGMLRVNHCAIISNSAASSTSDDSGFGGGLANFGTAFCVSASINSNSSPRAGKGCGVYSEGKLELIDCSVSGNFSATGSFRTRSSSGGGLFIESGSCEISDCSIVGNELKRLGNGAGMYVRSGDINIRFSLISSNQSFGFDTGEGGGIYNLAGNLNLTNSALTFNRVEGSESIPARGGGIANYGILSMDQCLVSGNFLGLVCSSRTPFAGGGGIYNSNKAAISNCTISMNQSADGCHEVGTDGGGVLNAGNLDINSTTITRNMTGSGEVFNDKHDGGSGGGVCNISNSTFQAFNSIIAGNGVANGGKGPDIFGVVISKGYNLIGSSSDMEIQGDQASNILNLDPRLGPLQDNGGPTWTHALLPNSPAINSGDPSLTGTDQRGVARPAGAGTDIGAFESDGSGPPPSIELLAPSFITLCSGKDLTIQARGFGTPPFTYQWRQNEQPLPSATSNILSLLNVTTNATGIYDVILSDRWGSVTSKVTSITILPPLQILREPVDTFVAPKGRAVFQVEATGSGLLPFRWYKNGEIIRNQIQPELVIEPATVADEGVYQVRVGDACSTYLSSNVVLRVIEPTVITRGPESISVELGAPARFTVEARGVEPLHYQWFRGSDPHPIPGATNSVIEITSAALEDETVYQVAISNLAGVIESVPARLTLLRHPLIVNIQGAGRMDRKPDQTSYFLGTSVQLEAVADRYWRFVGWEDGGTASIRSVTVRPGVAFAATFELTRPLETLSVGGVSRTAPAGMPALVIEDKLIADTNHFMRGPQLVKLISSLPNASLTYTLDGSEPNLLSTLYQGPFLVKTDAVVRVIAYSGDFTESVLGEPTTLHVLPVLNAYTAGGGNVQVDPPAGAYDAESKVRVTATPDSGWKFLEWLGDAEGSDLSVVIPMTQNRVVEAVFGGRFSTNVAGFGTIHMHPDMDWYPYGTTVRLTAIPERGNGFAFWGASLNTTNNPVSFVITQSVRIVTAVFTPLTSGDVVTLSVVSDGGGKTQVTPISNRYAKGSKVTLTATPDSGQEFVGWSGDITNVTNPLVVTLDQSVKLRAEFTSRPRISLAGPLGGRFEPFTRLQIESAPGMVLSVESSADLVEWRTLGKLTNTWGRTTWTDRSTDGVGHSFYKLTVVE